VGALGHLLQSPAGYVGVMGSSRRWKQVRNRLVEGGVDKSVLEDRVHVPIGIELGAETVEEIAVSILSEVIRVRRGAGASEVG